MCIYDVSASVKPSTNLYYLLYTGASAASSMHRLDRFYVDTKGAADSDLGGPNGNCRHDTGRGTGCEAGSHTLSPLLATGGRSAYARVADRCSLPPEVEQLRRNCVISASPSSTAQRATDKFA